MAKGSAGAGVTRRRAAQVLAVFAGFNLLVAAALLALQYPPAPGADDTTVPDFLSFWAAGRLAVEGTPWLAYDPVIHREVQRAAIGVAFEHWLVWYYPPLFQLLLMPLGALPLAPAMALWVGGTLALFLFACHRILPDRLALLGALAAAPTLINLVNGQTGFLVAALAGLALLWHRQRPPAGGAALALLAIKPHTVFALPLMMLAAGRWAVLLWAVAALAALVAASLLVLGVGTWAALLDHGQVVGGALGDADRRWDLNATLYAALRLLGLGPAPSLALHAAPALAALWLTARAWRSPAVTPEVQAALVCFATALATPRLLNYDLHILTIGVLFQMRHAARHGFFRGEAWLLGAVLLALEVSVFAPPFLTPLAAPALFMGCLFGHAGAALRGAEGPRRRAASGES